jgi:carbon-monoxide dehydrogenase large subunit
MTYAIAATRYAGSRIQRVEDVRLLTGRGTYVDDISLRGNLHAVFVRSPHAHARIAGIDTAEAAAVPGVHAVFLGRDLNPGVHEQWHSLIGPDSPETPRPPLVEDEVRFVGDPVALVVAEDRYIAEDAADLVIVDYELLPAVVDFRTAPEATELVHRAHGSNLIGSMGGAPSPDVAAAFDSADHVASETIEQQAQAACPMETRGIIVDCNPSTGEVTIYAATQAPHEWRAFCARLLGIPEHLVRVIMRDTGGGFGQKIIVLREDMAIMVAATKVSAPLKWIEDRHENLMAAGQSRHEQARASIAFDGEARITAARIDFLEDCGAYPSPWPVEIGAMIGTLFPGPYRVPRAAFSTQSIYTNTVGRSAYRGPWLMESIAREVVLDKAARELGMDPVELRRRNLLSRDELPCVNPYGMPFDYISPLETFDAAIAHLGYEAFRREQAEARRSGRYLGVGTCSYVEPTTPGQGTYATEATTIRIDPSGKVNVYVAGGSSGNSLETTVAQLVADALDVDITDVTVTQGDTALSGFGAGTGGSRSGSMSAGAVAETASVLRERIATIAAHQFEASPDDIELSRGRVFVRGTPSRAMTLAEVAALSYFQPDLLPPGVPPGLESTGRYKAALPWNYANATHVCTCEVDTRTGRVELLRYIVAEDCGPMINPNVVEGQIAGGTVQGIAGALFEQLAYDEDGNPLATTFMDYLVPTAAEVPDIEYVHVETPAPVPGGYKGVGEGGVLGSVGAVVNAVADALAPLGVTVSRLPLSPPAILDLIDGNSRS